MQPEELEEEYLTYIDDLQHHLPDGVCEIDMPYLEELGLLDAVDDEDDELSQCFFVVETEEKLTLFNEKFVVWIVPQIEKESPATYTLIALHEDEKTRLEMAFKTSGVYNQSALVLKILERFLDQIEENEAELGRIKPDEHPS